MSALRKREPGRPSSDRPERREATRILVVEDEQIVALELKDRLLQAGYDVAEVAASAEEAIDAAERLRPDLVMMDIKLQGSTDGIAAAEILRGRGDVPIVYLTAFADNDTVERAKATDPYGYVLKPFRERELRVAVEMALYRHRTSRRQRFLAEAGREISSSLDCDTLLSRLTQLIVRRLADWCAVHLQEDGNGPVLVHTFAHARTKLPMLSARVLLTALPRGGATCVERAIDGASSRERVADERAWIHDVLGLPPEQVDAAGLRASSFVCVPLFTRGRSLGALTLVSEHGRSFEESDVLLMEELGRLAGAGVENARLYGLAQRAIRVREDMLAIVSHDLKTPLSVISAGAESLLSPGVLSSSVRAVDFAQKIVRNAERMAHLVDDLLDLARIDSGQLAMEVSSHRADDLLADAVALFEAPAAERGVRLVIDAFSASLEVVCDRDRAAQVLANLIGNAIKLSPAGSTVRAGAASAGGAVRFHVSDEAGGIAPEAVDHIFERYWRAQRPSYPGLGLGLHIAKGIVEAHEGRIWVETRHGAGSTFYFTLPASPGAEPAR